VGFERPPVDRFEYRFEVAIAESRYDLILDPANPMRAPGAFGERSVIEFPEYQPPAWVATDGARPRRSMCRLPCSATPSRLDRMARRLDPVSRRSSRKGVVMRREHVVLHTVPIGDSNLIVCGHFGRPVLVFASDSGRGPPQSP
jgi:hypothetical protein